MWTPYKYGDAFHFQTTLTLLFKFHLNEDCVIKGLCLHLLNNFLPFVIFMIDIHVKNILEINLKVVMKENWAKLYMINISKSKFLFNINNIIKSFQKSLFL